MPLDVPAEPESEQQHEGRTRPAPPSGSRFGEDSEVRPTSDGPSSPKEGPSPSAEKMANAPLIRSAREEGQE
jgi:hypothetical protein